MLKKGRIGIDELLKWIIGVGILVIVVVGVYMGLGGKLFGAENFIKNLFDFGV